MYGLVNRIGSELIAAYIAFAQIPVNDFDDPRFEARSSQLESGYYLVEGKADHLIAPCRAHPDHHITFQLSYISLQELWSGDELIAAAGDIANRKYSGVYNAMSVPCMMVHKKKSLTYKVLFVTKHMHKLSGLPYISERPSFKVPYINLIQLFAGLMIFGICVYSFISFGQTIPRRTLYAFLTCTILLTMYFISLSLGYLGFSLNVLSVTKICALFLLFAIPLLTYVLTKSGVMSSVVFLQATMFLILALPFTVLAADWNVLQVSALLVFTSYSIVCMCAIQYALRQIWGGVLGLDLFDALAKLFLGAAGINDMALCSGVAPHLFPLFPCASVVNLFAQGLQFRRQFNAVFQERNDYRDKLEAAYQEKIEIIQQNAVSHAIANTVQTIAHEIKTPFALLSIVLGKLSQGAISPTQRDRMIDRVKMAKNDVHELLQELLVADGKQQNKLEPCDLTHLVETAWQRVTYEVWREGQLELSDSRVRLFVDRSKCLRVFQNLFKNALEASHDSNPVVKVSTSGLERRSSRDFIRIAVENLGQPKDPSKIFSKHYSRGKTDGSGLGLVICQDIVLSHGGDISCQVIEDSTKITLTLPIVAPTRNDS